jgi:hypothetical protein
MAFPAVEVIGRKLSAFHATDSLARPSKVPASRVDLSHVEIRNHAGEVIISNPRPTTDSQVIVSFLRDDSLQGEELFADTGRTLRHRQKKQTQAKRIDINSIVNEVRAETEPGYDEEPKAEQGTILVFSASPYHLAVGTSQ